MTELAVYKLNQAVRRDPRETAANVERELLGAIMGAIMAQMAEDYRDGNA